MSMKYSVIPIDTFKNLQLGAGVICSSFDTTTRTVTGILGATDGGSNVTAIPTYIDQADGIDNASLNTVEGKVIDYWTCGIAGTFKTVKAATIKTILGAGSIATAGTVTYTLTSDTAVVPGKVYYTRSGTEGHYVYTPVANPVTSSIASYYEVTAATPSKIVPVTTLSASDFSDVWWVGDYSDVNSGSNPGFIAVHLINALNVNGFQLQSNNKNKGAFSVSFVGHTTAAAPDTVPFEIYIVEGVA